MTDSKAEDKIIFMEPLFARAEEFGKTSLELLKLKTLDKTAALVSTLISRGAAVLILSLFTIIVNIGIALWLGDVFGKSYYGFFCVAAFYGIIGLILCLFTHKWVKKSISESIITQMLN
jgi:Na+/melibiose symporter-like transporter